jgi:hypothetical protein
VGSASAWLRRHWHHGVSPEEQDAGLHDLRLLAVRFSKPLMYVMIATTYCAPLPSHADVTFEKSALGPKINIFGTITKADANALPVFKGAAKPPAPCQGIPYKVVDRFCATVDPVTF